MNTFLSFSMLSDDGYGSSLSVAEIIPYRLPRQFSRVSMYNFSQEYNRLKQKAICRQDICHLRIGPFNACFLINHSCALPKGHP